VPDAPPGAAIACAIASELASIVIASGAIVMRSMSWRR
jgi:hypothetical protein